ncbi:hypothetical protein ABW19_dt0204572 [Dactylella cylindrospora]|nr:hypothetical protein ABW19_dt0204572 [Dactylella cylindrospora]
MSFFDPPKVPESKLSRYRLLAPSASVRVSPLCLSAMNIGTAWTKLMGGVEKKDAFALLDTFYKAGGNFIDTAVNYQNGQSEQWIGEWMKERGNRSEMVIATKVTTNYVHDQDKIRVNTAGNSVKNFHDAFKICLANLQVDYVDLLYVHWWDYSMSVEEMMQSLNVLVSQGKVLYLGISDTPAWVVSKANEYARAHGFRQFSVYQGRWSAAERDFERDIIAMCRTEGMGICPWGALGGGLFKLPEHFEEMKSSGEQGRNFPGMSVTEKSAAITLKLDKIGKARGLSITGVALAYVCSKAPYVIPIVGGRKISHLEDNIKAVGVVLTPEEIADIESAYEWEIGFPFNFFGNEPGAQHLGAAAAGWVDWPVKNAPIGY